MDQALKQWLARRKRGKDGNTKSKYLENEKSFLDEVKNIFHSSALKIHLSSQQMLEFLPMQIVFYSNHLSKNIAEVIIS